MARTEFDISQGNVLAMILICGLLTELKVTCWRWFKCDYMMDLINWSLFYKEFKLLDFEYIHNFDLMNFSAYICLKGDLYMLGGSPLPSSL